jgi:hypothetical protein
MYSAKAAFTRRLDLSPEDRSALLNSILTVAKAYLSPADLTRLTTVVNEVRRATSAQISPASSQASVAPSAPDSAATQPAPSIS